MDMIRFHKEMIRIHKECSELKTGSVMELLADNNIISFARFNREAATIVFINNNEFEVTKDIDVSALGIPKDAFLNQLILSDGSGFRTDIGGMRVKNNILTITLSRLSGLVLRYDSHAPISTEEFWADNTLDFG
jgi:alpha-glucosidase